MKKASFLKLGCAIAVMAAPAILSPSFAQGNGNGGKPGAEAKGNKGQGGKQQGGQKAGGDQGGGQSMKPQKQKDVARGGGNDSGKQDAVFASPGNSGGNRGNGDVKRVKDAVNGNGIRDAWVGKNGNIRPIVENSRSDWKRVTRRDFRPQPVVYRNDGDFQRLSFGNRYEYYNGCPPGLAKKQNGCTPPGLAKKRDYYDNWWSRDGDGYYRDGYLLRYEGNSLRGFLPLLGGALGLGSIFPTYYDSNEVPDYYARYYGGDDDYLYRQADGVIYGLDPQSYAIREIAGLVTGDQFSIGQRMPDGYSVYNVPYDYRNQYIDDNDNSYRYNDGYVYQVDPTTQLVQAVIQLLS